MTSSPLIAVLDYGSGNMRSAQRALMRAGAEVAVTSDPDICSEAAGLVVPGVGAFAACMAGIRSINGDLIVDRRLAGGRPVLGICVGMQVMFSQGVEHGEDVAGLDQWPGVVQRLDAPVLPHMGWNTVDAPPNSILFEGVEQESFYFVHSYGVTSWELSEGDPNRTPPSVTWTEYGQRFVSAVENGALMATQFHPEKSGDAGAQLLRNWISWLSE